MHARILIVEDNPQNLELMRYLLVAHGYGVQTAADGVAATEVLVSERPDLVLCDIQMPRMGGFHLLKWLRAQEALLAIPVIAVTALAMVGDRDKILASGFNGYLSKPITPETFVGEVGAYLPASQRAPPLRIAESVRETARLPVTGGRQMLLVDNLQSNLDFGEIVLQHLGYQAVQAKGMREAMQRLREMSPVLILSDVCMDDGSGFELLEAVRNDPMQRGIPFILISSTAPTEKDRIKGLALGADRYLFRPIEPRVLRAELEACLTARKAGS